MTNIIDIEHKKKYLLEVSKKYREFSYQTDSNCLQRYLAFRIILNAMSFEDMIGQRVFSDMRNIRNIFLGHKQEGNFFEAFNAIEIVTAKNIDELIVFMNKNTRKTRSLHIKVKDVVESKSELIYTGEILKKFEEEHHSGIRISNNFLCSSPNQIKELSSSPVSNIFYRLNSSIELSQLTNYLLSNFRLKSNSQTLMNCFVADYILHAVNIHDTVFKDTRNSHSIDGLYENMLNSGAGDHTLLDSIRTTSFSNTYNQLREIRNKIIGHMDKAETLLNLVGRLENFNMQVAYDFVNEIENAVKDSIEGEIVYTVHTMNNTRLPDNITLTNGIRNISYR